MKIQTLLNEDATMVASPATSLKYSDLNTLQIRTLQRIADGLVDVDSANDKEYDIIADLHDLGLLDDDYALTQRGQNAVAISKKLGGSSELMDAKRRQERMGQEAGDVVDDVEVEVGDEVPPEEEGDEEFNFDIGTRSATRFAM